MELPYYREVLTDLNERFGKDAWLTLRQIAEYDGVDPRTARKRYGIPRGQNGINKCVLARKIVEKTR